MRRAFALAAIVLVLACGKRKKGPSYNVIAVSADDASVCAVMKDASLRCWGAINDMTTPTTIEGVSATFVSVRGTRACAITTAKTVACLSHGKPVETLPIADVDLVAVGATHTCLHVPKKGIACWGKNDHGQLGNGTFEDSEGPRWVLATEGATQLAAGDGITCALLDDGGVRCWGRGDTMLLGSGDTTDQKSPVLVRDLGITMIAIGTTHACGRKRDETVVCWGKNDQGQLGDGTTADRLLPKPVLDVRGVDKLAVGRAHSCVRIGDSTLRCWGSNGSRELGSETASPKHLVPGLFEAHDVAVGDGFSCARMMDGWLRCWGKNDHGQLGDGSKENKDVPNPVHYL